MAGGRQATDYDTLALLLKAIAYPVRLELIDKLRVPRAPQELRLQPRRLGPGEHPDRPAARQTVLKHLEKLQEADLVRAAAPEGEGRAAARYVVNPQRLYALVEELRNVIVHHVGRESADDDTATASIARPRTRHVGPRVVLVHGIYEGQMYPLTEDTAQDGAWMLGRSEDHTVNLHYDPFVSHENTVIRRDEAGFTATDLGSKNGTLVNWNQLDPGRPTALSPGDVIGVGRSLLVFVPG